ncbi:hypothetical protein LZ30DRAFT_787820 [Colletotrichum cereale]|nr:hypothetical protein LZ30DRAFT_787820 [Colletotrichum cereale]
MADTPPSPAAEAKSCTSDLKHVEQDLRKPHADATDALAWYLNDELIDQAEEKRLLCKLDMRILLLLEICYFFYYVNKTTLSYAAIFGLKDGLYLKGEEVGVAGSGLIGYGIGHIKGALASWRYEFLVVGAFCAFWAVVLVLLLPNSLRTVWGFTYDEKLIMIACMWRNQTGIEQRRINWGQIREAYADYKTWLFTLLGFMSNVPNGGISNFSTLVIKGLGFGTLKTALLGIL